jgi:CheY-like chemotaxis protein
LCIVIVRVILIENLSSAQKVNEREDDIILNYREIEIVVVDTMDIDRPNIGHDENETDHLRDLMFDELRKALRHLYDPDALRKSALMHILPVDMREGQLALQRMLIEAIELLKPPSHLSTQSNLWRNYYVLSSRYVQQFHQDEVALGLGLSLRQMRRQENFALHSLADHLIGHFNLTSPEKISADASAEASAQVRDGILTSSIEEHMPSQDDELLAVGRSQKIMAMELGDLIIPLVKTVEPLAAGLNVRVRIDLPNGLPQILVSQTAVRQAILMLLTALIRECPGSTLMISAHASGDLVFLSMVPQICVGDWEAGTPEDFSFSQRLVELSGGELTISRNGLEGNFVSEVIISLNAVQRVRVLVVDDNPDALQLYQRYFAGTLYTFYGTTEPEQALQMAENLHPRIILLDVMMPGIDGWELLSRLREHPITRDIPIIVSTILPQEQLAKTLGAASFIRKPVSQPALLQALDGLVGPGAQGSG